MKCSPVMKPGHKTGSGHGVPLPFPALGHIMKGRVLYFFLRKPKEKKANSLRIFYVHKPIFNGFYHNNKPNTFSLLVFRKQSFQSEIRKIFPNFIRKPQKSIFEEVGWGKEGYPTPYLLTNPTPL